MRGVGATMHSLSSAADEPVSPGNLTAVRRREEFVRPFGELLELLAQAKSADIYPLFPTLEPADKPGWAVLDGTPKISMIANDYLGLGRDQRVAEAMHEAVRKFSGGRCASPLVGGYTDAHRKLENALAEFLGQQTAIVFASGYQANLGVISGLMRSGDLVVCDLYSHASIVDGVRLSGAEARFFQHNNAAHLDLVLRSATSARKLVVVEGVYSADGDIGALREICAAAHRHGAMVMVDEAHSFGVLGPLGKGASELHGVLHDVDLIVGTMSKSIGLVGGFAAGDRELLDVISHNARALIFSASLPPVIAAGAVRSLEIIAAEPERRERLWRGATRMLSGLREMGFNTLNSETPVLPVLVGDPSLTLSFTKDLADVGLLVCPGIPPMVQPHLSRIRMHVTSEHDDGTITRAIHLIQESGRRHGLPSIDRVDGDSDHDR
jgi:8-amino-7-oxononanoate synthase